jgi:hypothetical protein
VTIDERLEKLTERHEVLTETVELLGARLETLAQKQDHEASVFRRDLNRVLRLGVAEARNERRRRRALEDHLTTLATTMDGYVTKLAAAQLLTEDKFRSVGEELDGLIDSLRRGGNGKGSPG